MFSTPTTFHKSYSTLTPAQTIRKLRKQAGMTQDELARAMGMSQGFISDLERGTAMPDDDVYERLREILKDLPPTYGSVGTVNHTASTGDSQSGETLAHANAILSTANQILLTANAILMSAIKQK